MGRLRLFAIDEDAEKKANILLCEDLQKNGLAARMRPSNNALKSYVGVVASRSRRQAETKQQRTAAAVVATMTRSRCKGETKQQVLVGQAANSPRNCADTGTNPVQTRATFQSESKEEHHCTQAACSTFGMKHIAHGDTITGPVWRNAYVTKLLSHTKWYHFHLCPLSCTVSVYPVQDQHHWRVLLVSCINLLLSKLAISREGTIIHTCYCMFWGVITQ